MDEMGVDNHHDCKRHRDMGIGSWRFPPCGMVCSGDEGEGDAHDIGDEQIENQSYTSGKNEQIVFSSHGVHHDILDKFDHPFQKVLHLAGFFGRYVPCAGIREYENYKGGNGAGNNNREVEGQPKDLHERTSGMHRNPW